MFDLVNTRSGFPARPGSPFLVQKHKKITVWPQVFCIYSFNYQVKYIPLYPVTPSSGRHSIN